MITGLKKIFVQYLKTGGIDTYEAFQGLTAQAHNHQFPFLSGLRQFRIAGLSWDTNLIAHYWRLRTVVGPFAGEQFTPSDPLPVIGILNPKLAKSVRKVRVEIEVRDR